MLYNRIWLVGVSVIDQNLTVSKCVFNQKLAGHPPVHVQRYHDTIIAVVSPRIITTPSFVTRS